MTSSHCELCGAAAAVFCPSDAAFLCRTCDTKVHQANFLVARHVRQSVCSACTNLSGAVSKPRRETCPSCSPASDGDACSSDCVSSTTTPASDRGGRCSGSRPAKKRGSRPVDYSETEGIFADWCGKLGVGADVAVRTARDGLRACSAALPFRVCLAASMWFGLRLGGERLAATWKVLKRLEEVSGVPAKVIMAVELKLERGLRGGRRLELEEGMAEC